MHATGLVVEAYASNGLPGIVRPDVITSTKRLGLPMSLLRRQLTLYSVLPRHSSNLTACRLSTLLLLKVAATRGYMVVSLKDRIRRIRD